MVNHHRKGYLRDRELFRLLEDQVSLNTDQIRLLLFNDTCLRVVQRRLKILSDTGKINRGRVSIDEPCHYYPKAKPGQLDHVLGVSWIYTWVFCGLDKAHELHSFDREVKYNNLRPDALICVKNTWKESFSFFFGEFDIVDSGHDFAEKVKRYNDFYATGEYLKMWWVPLSKRFPVIRVVTTGKIETIQKKIDKENINNLEFQVFSLDQVKGECLNGSSSTRSIRTK